MLGHEHVIGDRVVAAGGIQTARLPRVDDLELADRHREHPRRPVPLTAAVDDASPEQIIGVRDAAAERPSARHAKAAVDARARRAAPRRRPRRSPRRRAARARAPSAARASAAAGVGGEALGLVGARRRLLLLQRRRWWRRRVAVSRRRRRSGLVTVLSWSSSALSSRGIVGGVWAWRRRRRRGSRWRRR